MANLFNTTPLKEKHPKIEEKQVISLYPMATGGGGLEENREEHPPPTGQAMRRSDSAPVGIQASWTERLYASYYRFKYGRMFNSSIQMGNTPIVVMGNCHIPDKDMKQFHEGTPEHILKFIEEFNSITWVTYRSGFPPIHGTSLTTDCGWGCMVRSGQMLLATALQFHLLGRDWRLCTSNAHGHAVHRQILSWFGDNPSGLHPFSIHRLMESAVSHGNTPGDWFGPSQVAMLIRDCVRRAISEHVNLNKLNIYVAHDCTIYSGDVMEVFSQDMDQSLLVLVPVRLGSEALNPIYIPCVKSLLALDHSVGIIGGRPKHSVYFIGYQDDSLIHLDPHYLQKTVNMEQMNFDISTYHCRYPRKLSVQKMDPSCTLGFYCHTIDDYRNFKEQAEKVLAPPMQKGYYPFFSFSEKCVRDIISPEITITTSALRDDVHDPELITEFEEDDGFVVLEYGDDPDTPT